jgi:hypothetical protein
MRVLLDVKESKALFFIVLLNSFSSVKIQPISERKAFLSRKTGKADVIVEEETVAKKENAKKDIFADVWGIWADRDIDGRTLRNQAWGIER